MWIEIQNVCKFVNFVQIIYDFKRSDVHSATTIHKLKFVLLAKELNPSCRVQVCQIVELVCLHTTNPQHKQEKDQVSDWNSKKHVYKMKYHESKVRVGFWCRDRWSQKILTFPSTALMLQECTSTIKVGPMI